MTQSSRYGCRSSTTKTCPCRGKRIWGGDNRRWALYFLLDVDMKAHVFQGLPVTLQALVQIGHAYQASSMVDVGCIQLDICYFHFWCVPLTPIFFVDCPTGTNTPSRQSLVNELPVVKPSRDLMNFVLLVEPSVLISHFPSQLAQGEEVSGALPC